MGSWLTQTTACAGCSGGVFLRKEMCFIISQDNAANAFISSFIVTAKEV